MLSKPIEQQLLLEDRDGSVTVKRRTNNRILMNSTGRADMVTMGNGRDNEDDDEGQDRDSSGDLDGTEVTVQWILPVWTVETRQRIASRQRWKGRKLERTQGEWERQNWQRLEVQSGRKGKGERTPKHERVRLVGPV